jgi:hypothetical protein
LIDAFILSLDRIGFNIMACCDEDSWIEMRMPFDRVVTDLQEYIVEFNKVFDHPVE